MEVTEASHFLKPVISAQDGALGDGVSEYSLYSEHAIITIIIRLTLSLS
mgnify:CR=1 FL=1